AKAHPKPATAQSHSVGASDSPHATGEDRPADAPGATNAAAEFALHSGFGRSSRCRIQSAEAAAPVSLKSKSAADGPGALAAPPAPGGASLRSPIAQPDREGLPSPASADFVACNRS